MFSNEELRTAMDGLVKQKGEDHTSFGRYADPFGKGACFLGALCEYMGRAIPAEGIPAQDVLGKGALTPEMGRAFQVAQYLNDQHYEWKYVLMGVDLMLAKRDAGEYSTKGCPCGCNIPMGVIAEVAEEVKQARILDKAQMPKVDMASFTTPGFKASGGTINGITAGNFGQVIINLDSVSESIYTLQAGMNSFVEAFVNATPQKAAVKKDHALVA